MPVSIFYGIFLLRIGMYGIIWVTCVFWKEYLPNENGCLCDWIEWILKIPFISLFMVLYRYGVFIYGNWLEELVCSSSLLWGWSIPGFFLSWEMSKHKVLVIGKKRWWCLALSTYYVIYMTESTSLLQCVHLHARLLHPIRVGIVHLSCNHGIVKLIISKTIFFHNHTYRMFSLVISSLVFSRILHVKSTRSSHQQSPCVMINV